MFPDRLPQATDGSAAPPPVKAEKVNKRGKRAVKPAENRAHGPSEDR